MGFFGWVALEALVVSLIGNLFLAIYVRRAQKAPTRTLELREFVHDLTRNGGLIKVSRVDPDDILLRSPRERVS